MNVEEALLILDTALEKTFLNNVQELVFRQAWEGQTYSEIAETCGYNANYIKDIGSKLWKLLSKAFAEEVTKSNFRAVIRRQYVTFQDHWCASQGVDNSLAPLTLTHNFSEKKLPSIYTENNNSQNTQTDLLKATPEFVDAKETTANTTQDGEKVVDISALPGRKKELDTLTQWIMDNRCRLVAVVGMEGIGKTALLVNNAEPIKDKFDLPHLAIALAYPTYTNHTGQPAGN